MRQSLTLHSTPGYDRHRSKHHPLPILHEDSARHVQIGREGFLKQHCAETELKQRIPDLHWSIACI